MKEQDPNQKKEMEELEKKIAEAKTQEELLDVINQLTDDLPKDKVIIKKIRHQDLKSLILISLLELVISFGIMLGVTGLFQPFELQLVHGDLYFMGIIAFIQLIIGIIIGLFKNPFVLLLGEVIKDILIFISIMVLSRVIPFVSFIDEWSELSFIIIYLASKSIIITALKKLMKV